MSVRGRRIAQLVSVGVVAAGVGFGARSLLPPFADDPFWRAFWSGPPMAGLFAIVAAAVAFYPAYRSTLIARENAAREQWWKRAEWALGKLVLTIRLTAKSRTTPWWRYSTKRPRQRAR